VSSPNEGPQKRKVVPTAERSREGEGLGSVLDGLLRERPWRSGMALGALGRRWAEVVGDRLAEESRPARLERGVLTVKASSAPWAAQIGFLADEVARRSNEVLGAGSVATIKVMVEGAEARSRPPRGSGVGGSG
jgi:predicted nucleic acid-binding Zn ribbon protein